MPKVRAVAALLSVLALAGCTAGPGPSGTSPAASQAGGSASGSTGNPTAGGGETASVPLTGTKRAKGAQLPTKVGDWTRQKRFDLGGGTWQYLYAKPGDAAAHVTATISLVTLTSGALDQTLSDRQAVGAAQCGTAVGGARYCYLPLSGGNLAVTGTLPLDQLGQVSQQLLDALA